jgi:hypothetical protein
MKGNDGRARLILRLGMITALEKKRLLNLPDKTATMALYVTLDGVQAATRNVTINRRKSLTSPGSSGVIAAGFSYGVQLVCDSEPLTNRGATRPNHDIIVYVPYPVATHIK